MKLALLLLLLFVSSAAAQQLPTDTQDKQVDSFTREHNDKRAENPEGLLFTVRLTDPKRQFHLGEVITLELSFASSKPDTFILDAATYDRSGRLHSDGFVLDQREGAVDPIADYFQADMYGYMMGGLRGIPDLTEKPHLITVELNEWQRIDKPGHYRLYVVSSRLGRKTVRGNFSGNGLALIVSNIVEFDVLPADKKWATQKLNDIISALSKTGGDRRASCRALRFLGTPAAVPEMRKRFRGDDNECEWQYKFGLIGSPHRELVIRDMENAISAREQAVTSHFISTLALLEFMKQETTIPPYPAAGTEEQISQWRALADRRRRVFDDLQLNYVRRLVIAIPQKQAQARATSLQTLLDFQSRLNTNEFSQWSSLLASIPEVFNRLPLEDQLHLLSYQWKQFASPAMLPVLREIFNYTYSKSQKDAFNQFRQEELRSIALRRLYELSPEDGRRLLVKEIGRPEPRLGRDVLRSLPDETLPELTTALLDNLEAARRNGSWSIHTISGLVERYANDDGLSRVQAVYESREVGQWECGTEAALLAYFLRVAPAIGSEYLKKAMLNRNKGVPRCYTERLNLIAPLHMSAEVEDVAIAALKDEDAEVVSQAATVLGNYGSADGEKQLWRRLEDLQHELESQSEAPNDDQEKIEKALSLALARGEAWLSDPEKLKRVRELCRTEKSRSEIERMISGWNNQIYVDTAFFADKMKIELAQYEFNSVDSLKAKLLQYPKGSAFKLKMSPSRGDEVYEEKVEVARQVRKTIEDYLEEKGMKLKREPEP